MEANVSGLDCIPCIITMHSMRCLDIFKTANAPILITCEKYLYEICRLRYLELTDWKILHLLDLARLILEAKKNKFTTCLHGQDCM